MRAGAKLRRSIGLINSLNPTILFQIPEQSASKHSASHWHVAGIGNVLFNGTPDSRITSHPIAFGSGDWTVATGVLEAIFSDPMKLPNGKTIAPMGRKLKIAMATIARWKNGCIAEEILFWHNAEYLKQLRLSK